MPSNILDELRRENEVLQSRIEALQQELRFATRADRTAPRPPAKPETILGLDLLILFVSPDGRIRYLNSAFARHLRRGRDELQDLPLAEIDQQPWGAGLLADLFTRVLEQQRIQEVETRYFDAISRDMKYVIVRATPGDGGVQFIVEDRSRFKHLESIFNRYVSPRVIQQLMESGKDYLSAEQVELTLLFSDLRGFTAASRNLSPQAVKRLIDRHLEAIIEVIISEDGTVNSIMGDGVMSFFGAPMRFRDHPIRALNAALKMQAAHERVMQEWRAEGLPELQMGIGLNTGQVVVGNIGCELRMEYTALGHDVNLAARLCQAANGGEIIMSTGTFEKVKAMLEEKLSRLVMPVKFHRGIQVQAKGIDEPVPTIAAIRTRG